MLNNMHKIVTTTNEIIVNPIAKIKNIIFVKTRKNLLLKLSLKRILFNSRRLHAFTLCHNSETKELFNTIVEVKKNKTKPRTHKIIPNVTLELINEIAPPITNPNKIIKLAKDPIILLVLASFL